MKRVLLGKTDLSISRLCLGGAKFGAELDREQSFAVLDAFWEAGGNFIDTAGVYCRWLPGVGNCSEEMLGRWLGERGLRDRVVIATKGGHYDFGAPQVSRVTREDIRADLEDSLKTLGLKTIPLYWLHRDDPDKPVEELLDWMEELVGEGKIRWYGASNFTLERLEAARICAKRKGIRGFSAVSNQWSLAVPNPGANVNPDPSLVVAGQEQLRWHRLTGMPLVPFSSTAYGFFDKLHRAAGDLTGAALKEKVEALPLDGDLKRAYLNEENLASYDTLLGLHRETGESLYTLSVAWLLHQPFQVVPVGAVSHPGQLEGLLRADAVDLPAWGMPSWES